MLLRFTSVKLFTNMHKKFVLMGLSEADSAWSSNTCISEGQVWGTHGQEAYNCFLELWKF